MRRLFVTTCLLSLCSCATLSFAPPQVRHDREIYADNEQTFFNATCTPNHADTNPLIKKNVEGALALIDNYILTYRCQRDRAAEGRQFFEVPAFLATAGGVAAAAFGAPADVAIGTSAGAAALAQGKSYYAPKDKGKVLADGLKAMLCIHNEAVGIDGPTIEAISQVQKNSGTTPPPQEPPKDPPKDPPNTGIAATSTGTVDKAGDEDDGPIISVPYDRQYFNMIATSLWSVEQVVSDRLSDSGAQFDMSGVVAELDKLKQEAADKEKAATPDGKPANAATPITNAPPPTAPPTTPPNSLLANFQSERLLKFNVAHAVVKNIGDEQIGKTIIQLKSLQPKLDRCVVQAKV